MPYHGFFLIYNLILLFCLGFGIPMDSLNSFIFFLNQFTFYPDLLELAQSSDYSVIEAQTFTQKVYHGHQLLHIRKVASDKICKLRQFAMLLFASISYFLYLFGLLPFPLSGFVFKFKDACHVQPVGNCFIHAVNAIRVFDKPSVQMCSCQVCVFRYYLSLYMVGLRGVRCTPFVLLMSSEKHPISLLFLRLSLCFFSLLVASVQRVSKGKSLWLNRVF